ncbi:Histone deacetylase 11 [Collichthys lucidus]|uniref:Histone deacetylase 11 n=1 Tax=Collichthys lucidus TaxID=240159 RepID=A0A4U5UA30_COLLU|nr:Histone deacetylase 11 [Collichthys lucidus]
MKEHKAKIITRQLVDALNEIHSKGVFHGDIKSDNILIETSSDVPRVRIIDFGCGAFLSDATHIQCRVFLGSPPESAHRTELYTNIPQTCMPIVYHPDYNITFMGLEKLHPFDAGKWGKVIHFLKEEEFITDGSIVEAREATEEDLLVVHTKRYLNRLKWSLVVATITEIPPLLFLPNFLVQRKVLRPLRTQTGGTIMAGKLAVDRGWAINVGGGFHHCSGDKGGGFCAYADITLAIKFLFERVEGISRATIIDLDAHQGNGHERDFLDDRRVFIMDMYNRYIYPGDGFAKRAIKRKVELDWGTEDSEYLQKVELHSEGALNEVRPDIIIYNAGTDILDGDPLGGLSISPQGIVKRDEIVFRAARQRGVPILMVTSGGYQKKTARIIADSILNLHRQGLIGGEALEGEGSSSLVTSMMCPSGSAGSKFTAV